jgi:hypothetical protein
MSIDRVNGTISNQRLAASPGQGPPATEVRPGNSRSPAIALARSLAMVGLALMAILVLLPVAIAAQVLAAV